MKTCRSCLYLHKMLNKENIKKYGKYYCMYWEMLIKNTKGCFGHTPKEDKKCRI